MNREIFEAACTTWLGEREPSTTSFAQLVAASFHVFGTNKSKIKLRLDDQETRAVWDAAKKAKTEVASWPAWKRGEATVAVPNTFQRELAKEFEVAVSTIYQWAKGTVHPHPLLQKQIIKSLLRHAASISDAE